MSISSTVRCSVALACGSLAWNAAAEGVPPSPASAPAAPSSPAPTLAASSGDAWSQAIASGLNQEGNPNVDEIGARKATEAHLAKAREGFHFAVGAGVGFTFMDKMRNRDGDSSSGGAGSAPALTKIDERLDSIGGKGLVLSLGARYGLGAHFDIEGRATLAFEASSASSYSYMDGQRQFQREPEVSGTAISPGLEATFRWLPGLGPLRWYGGIGPRIGSIAVSGTSATGDYSFSSFLFGGVLESGVVFGDSDQWEVGARFVVADADKVLLIAPVVMAGRVF
jgi:hypothetical protein